MNEAGLTSSNLDPVTDRVTMVRLLIPAAIWTVLGCTERSSDASSTGYTIWDSAGVRIVETRVSLWSSGIPRWTVDSVPAVEIVGDAPDGSYYLFGAFYIQQLENGGLVVGNRGTSELLMFDAGGDFLHSVGGPGEGPGEFYGVYGLHRCDGDSLVVDEGRRVSFFDAQGRFVRTDRVLGQLTDSPGRIEGVSPDCSALLLFSQRYRPASPGEGVYRLTQTLSWASLDGGLVDTLVSFPGEERVPWNMAGQLESAVLPYGKEPVWALGGDRVYLGLSDRFEVRVFDRTGSLLEIRRWGAEAQPVTDAEWDAFAEQRRTYRRENPSRAWIYPPPEHFPVPETKPAYARFLVDDEGNLWVQHYPPWDDPIGMPSATGDQNWSVLDRTGRWLGEIRMPPDLDVRAVHRDHVIGLSRDEHDVERIRLYAVNKGDR